MWQLTILHNRVNLHHQKGVAKKGNVTNTAETLGIAVGWNQLARLLA
jgi:hypothetical protein